MTVNIIQPSFTSGELSPSLYARVDLAKYHSAAATMRNMYVDYRGGTSTRPGTQYIATSGQLGTAPPPRLIPFQFNTDQTYILELGDQYIRFYKDGAQIMSGGSPLQVATPYAAGDLPLLKFTQSADVLTFTHPDYAPRNLNRFSDTSWTLTEVTFTPRQAKPSINSVRPLFTGSANSLGGNSTTYRYVLTAVNADTGEESYPSDPQSCTNAATMTINSGEAVLVTWTPLAGVNQYRVYRQEEVPGSAPADGSLFGLVGTATQAKFWDRNTLPDFAVTPPRPASPFSNGLIGTITITDGGSGYSDLTTVAISDPTGVGWNGYPMISGGAITGVVTLNPGFGYSAPTISFSDPGSRTVTGVSIASAGANYLASTAAWITDTTGFGATLDVGLSNGTIVSASVTNAGSDYSASPVAVVNDPGGGAGGVLTLTVSSATAGSGAIATAALSNPNEFPGVSCYFAQRQVFAATNDKPENFWMTRVGAFTNMSVSIPSQPEDAISDTIASIQVNAIKWLVPMSTGLIVLSSGGAWLVSGSGSGAVAQQPLTPSTVQAQPQAYNGCSDVPPIQINYDILYVEAKSSIVRDLSWNFYVNIWTGTDITVLSDHLFFGRTVREWAWAEEPFKLIWLVRDDGVLLSCTFMKEQELQGWARHDTNGLFQSVASISEGSANAVYFVVKRFVGGIWNYYIERLADRNFGTDSGLGIPADPSMPWCVDAGLQYPMPQPASDLQPGFGSNVVGASVSMFANGDVFSTGSVSSVIRATGGVATITAFVTSRQVTATVTAPFALMPDDPSLFPVTASEGTWTMTAPVTSISGLDHLEGLTVSILADGNVVTPQVVKNGSITLQQPATAIKVGLGYTCQLQTLYMDVGEPTIQGKRKKINAVTVFVQDARGIAAGRTFKTLVPIKQWNNTIPMGGPLPLVTGMQRIVLDPLYDTGGQMCMQVSDPVPATILGVVPEITLGDTP